jgi:hypothetical protein
MSTTGADLLLVAFEALSAEEQEQAFEGIAALRLRRQAEADAEAGRYLRSLQRVQQHLGQTPTVTSYRRAWRELRQAGEEVDNLSAVIKHFGSWRQAREALDLSATTSKRKIEARFAARRLDKVWRYTDKTLQETLASCVESYGYIPQLAEFEWWRQQQLELAKAKGDDALHLPSSAPYRRRFGSWEKAVLALDYSPPQIKERLERSGRPRK